MNCLDCGKELVRAPSGRCGPCGNRFRAKDPTFRAKVKVGLDRKWSDQEYRARMSEKARRHALAMNANEAIQEHRRAAGRLAIKRLFEPEIRAKCLQAVRERSGKTQSENRIAWCPPEYRDQYWFMRRSKRMTLAECKEIIAAQIKADEAKLSPFERQERALAKGAKLVANDRGPMFGEARRSA